MFTAWCLLGQPWSQSWTGSSMQWVWFDMGLSFCARVSFERLQGERFQNSSISSKPNPATQRPSVSTLPSYIYTWFDHKGVQDRWMVWGFLNPLPYPQLGQDQPPHPPSHPNLKPFNPFFFFFDNAILKALCLVIPLCEHVNDNLLQKC